MVRASGGEWVGPLGKIWRVERTSKGKVEDARAPKEIGGFLFFFFLPFCFKIIYSLLRYKKSRGALAMAKTKPTQLNYRHPRHPLLGKGQAPQNQRTPPLPIQHLRRKQDEAIPSS